MSIAGRERRLWSFERADFATPWKPVPALAAVLAMMALMLLLDVVLFGAILALRHPEAVGSKAAYDALSDIDKYLPAIVAGVLAQGLLIAGVFYLAGRRGADPWAVLMLGPPRTGPGRAALTVAGFVAATFVLAGAVYVIFPYDPMKVTPFMGELAASPYWWLLLVMVMAGAPLFEELWFRGFLFPALAKSRLGVAGAAMVSSALWASMHLGYPPQVLVLVFLIGLMLTSVLLRSGSLWLPILCHAAYNGSSFLYFLWAAEQAAGA